jgi:alkanesulfonate monooxygenase SsuD/methylene tetrahydromethanopterin reductase-like flavin-dependent oxidoreductase (luciferase family)
VTEHGDSKDERRTMKFGFITEGDTKSGTTHYTRYHELVEQVQVAEKMGFDMFGASEQHLAIGGASTSAPEILYGYIMALTSRIRFAHAIVLLPMRFNHPIRVAERIATLDIMSHGRMEAAMGRGNTMLALRGFEVSPEDNRAQQLEAIDVIRTAFLDDPFSFVGHYYKIPPRSLVPKPVQYPHPPLALAATSPASHTLAAEKGIGVVSFANFSGFDVLRKNLSVYDRVFDETQHTIPTQRNKAVLISGLVCAETTAEAREEFLPILEYVKLAVDAYDRLATTDDTYAYVKDIKQNVDENVMDVDYMLNDSASFIVGSPDDCIDQVRQFEALGIDEMWLRIDTTKHEEILGTIERFGKYVIPHFKSKHAVVRTPEDVIAGIRAMRESHYAKLAEFEESVRDGSPIDKIKD